MELEEGRLALEKQGYRLAAISYDSVEILSDFAKRHRIGYTFLSDPDSALIKSLGLLNINQPRNSIKYGVPYPGAFMVDPTGKIFSKHFKDEPLERETLNSILSSALNVRTGLLEQRLTNKHLSLTASATNDLVRPYQRIRVQLDFRLKSKMHVYAPGVIGYKPIALRFQPSTAFEVSGITYPASKTLHMKAINETVPIFDGNFSILANLLILGDPLVSKALNAAQRLEVKADLLYQACDHKVCYLPESLPLTWTLQYENLLVPRAPEPIRHQPPKQP